MQGFVENILTDKKPLARYHHLSDGNNSGTTETDVFVDTIPGNILSKDGDSMEFIYGIVVAATAAGKTIKVYFGGNVIFNSTNDFTDLGGSNVYNLYLRILVIRDSSTSIRIIADMSAGFFNAGFFYVLTEYFNITGLTLSNSRTVKITAKGGASNDVTIGFGKIYFST